jgi:DNA-binding PadR family transcriptional regulator
LVGAFGVTDVDKQKVSSYNCLVRRRAGVLLPIELDILDVAARAHRHGDAWVHGFAVARQIRDDAAAGRLTAHGTLYKALGRLAEAGLLEDRWEDADDALAAGRPRRRLYRITGVGQQALATAMSEVAGRVEPRIAPS